MWYANHIVNKATNSKKYINNLKGAKIMSERKFFICKHCKNLVEVVNDSKVPMICCGEKMTELVANTVEASQEKHLPVVEVSGNEVSVTVGSVIHPMEEAHFIQWVYLLTDKGVQRKALKPGEVPSVKFSLLEGEKALAAYEYCNLHGLWKTVIE